jgi:hypothetical protein
MILARVQVRSGSKIPKGPQKVLAILKQGMLTRAC